MCNNKLKLIFGLILTLGFFASCSNEPKNVAKPVEEGYFTVSGNVTFSASDASDARMAITSFSPAEAFGDSTYLLRLTATMTDDTSTTLTKDYNLETINDTFSYTQNLALGSWTLRMSLISVTEDEESGESSEAEILYDSKTVTYSADNYNQTVDFVLTPTYTSGNGDINLKIIDSTSAASIDYITLYDSTKSDSIFKTPVKISKTEGQFNIAYTDIAANQYNLHISFYSNDYSEALYECDEIISVCPKFVTDSWYPSASYFVENEDGSYDFVITDEMLSSYNAKHQNVPETEINLSDTEDDYAVDSNGVIYTFDADSKTFTASEEVFKVYDSFTADYKMSKTCTLEDFVCPYEHYSVEILVDPINDNLALYFYDTWYYNSILYYYPNLISSGDTLQYSKSFNSYYTHCTLYNDILYGISIHEYTCLYASNIKASGVKTICDDLLLASGIVTSRSSSIKPDDPAVTDIMMQEGSLYILVRINEVLDSESVSFIGILSRGALIKVDNLTADSPSYDVLGWTDDDNIIKIEFTEEGTNSFRIAQYDYEVYAYNPFFSANDTTSYFTFTEAEILARAKPYVETVSKDDGTYEEVTYELKDNPLLIHAPITSNGSLSTTNFYGPRKFVALKPKKLVIADDGLAFYTDADGLWSYKNVNRIVTVDLESFAIEESQNVTDGDLFTCKSTNNIYLNGATSGFGEYQKCLKLDFEKNEDSYWCYDVGSGGFSDTLIFHNYTALSSSSDSVFLYIPYKD